MIPFAVHEVPTRTLQLVELLCRFRAYPTVDNSQAVVKELRRGSCELRVLVDLEGGTGPGHRPARIIMDDGTPMRGVHVHTTMDHTEAEAHHRAMPSQRQLLVSGTEVLGWLGTEEVILIWIDPGLPTETFLRMDRIGEVWAFDATQLFGAAPTPPSSALSSRQERKARIGRAPRP